MSKRCWLIVGLLMGGAVCSAQDRNTRVRDDRRAFEGSTAWVYNDLAKGLAEARASQKPMLVVFR
jgi:hypothetical protein